MPGVTSSKFWQVRLGAGCHVEKHRFGTPDEGMIPTQETKTGKPRPGKSPAHVSKERSNNRKSWTVLWEGSLGL